MNENIVTKIKTKIKKVYQFKDEIKDDLSFLYSGLGKLLSNQQNLLNFADIKQYEFKIFSQFGDDGIIQYLIKNIKIQNKTFIEFGIENYNESNTRFLLFNDNWSGYVMDGSKDNIDELKSQGWYWLYDLRAKSLFIDKDNINSELANSGFENVGLLSIDIDGNDYWIWEVLNISKLNPAILILEYNSVFGKERAITVPYDPKFIRNTAHYSNLYYGASLKALYLLSRKKGYEFIGCNSAGNNAYFIRKDLLNDKIKAISLEEGYVESKYREGREKDNSLSLFRGQDRLAQIKGLPVVNIENNKLEKL